MKILLTGILGGIVMFIWTSVAHMALPLGETGIRILMRLMGLLLVALAVQFVANGLTDFGLLKPLTLP